MLLNELSTGIVGNLWGVDLANVIFEMNLNLILRLFDSSAKTMTDVTYPIPHHPTLADLDPESATTDALIARVRSHREGESYLTPEQLLAHLPVVLRAMCDVLLVGEITGLDAAYRLASIIDAMDGAINPPGLPSIQH